MNLPTLDMNAYLVAIPVLTFLTVAGIGGALIAMRAARRKPVEARLGRLQSHGGAASAGVSTAGGSGPGFVKAIEKIGTSVGPRKPAKSLQQDLALAGYHGPGAVPVFLGAKVTLFVVGVAVSAPLAFMFVETTWARIFWVMVGGVILSYVPNLYMERRRAARAREIRRHLPDTIDLLEICVSAGMGLEQGWNSVTDEMRQVSPILADEMALTNLESHLGAPTAEAMKHMAERTRVQEVSSLTATLIQSERFGTSISDALKVFAGSMREERSLRAHEAAEKVAVKMIVPLVLFIFPPIVIVMAGPALIRMAAAIN